MRIKAVIPFIWLIIAWVFPGGAMAGNGEKEISIEDLDNKSINLQSLNPMRLPGKSYDDRAHQTIITGYIVTSYKYNDTGVEHHGQGNELHFGQDVADTTNFGFNVMEIGFTKRYSDYAWVAAAMEVGLHNELEGGTTVTKTQTELDTGEIHLVAPVGNGVDFTLGKFNSPVSFEQEDAPLLLQATHSLTFQFASPSKMVGLMAVYPILENLDVRAAVFNGWNANAGDTDNNKAKSIFFQVGFAPTRWADLKLSFLRGAEQDDNEKDNRNVLDIAGTLTPWRNWIFGFEFAYGHDENQSLLHPGTDAKFYSGQATIHHDFFRWFGTTLRYSFVADEDGHPDIGNNPAEPGEAQQRTWNQISVAPVFHISPQFLGFMGFGVIPRTQHLLSGIDLRLEYRYDWVNESANNRLFRDIRNTKLSTRNMFIAELVASF
ncbi:MAG: outer membrane beta-barrel protein [Nitrospinaceae bacterium]